jgi:hypothetical protein
MGSNVPLRPPREADRPTVIADDLRVAIRQKLAAGILPKDEPVAVAVGRLDRRTCDACGVEPDHAAATRFNDPLVECEVTVPDGRTFRFHQLCLTIWHEERDRYLLP